MSERKPLVSVVMPVFNTAAYLDDAIQSILNQTLTDFEFIIINDGSTDNSLALVKYWAEKDQRIKIYDQQNKGRSFTRNRSLQLASSDLIAMMDSDDISLPHRLAVQYEFMNNNPNVVVVGGQLDVICMMGVDLFTTNFSLLHEEIEKAILHDNGIELCQPTTMMRKSVALDVGAYNEEYQVGEDCDLFLRMALKGDLANLPIVLLKYRTHLNNTTSTQNLELYRGSLPRIQKAWQSRNMELPHDFKHWSEGYARTQKDDLLRWGWNALVKNQIGTARYYAKKLLFLGQYDINVLRFLVCTLRGR